MAIEDFMNTDFTINKRTEVKVGGRNKMEYIPEGNTYQCAIFTPAVEKTVRFGKQDFILVKNFYCPVNTPVELGDIIVSGGTDYDVVSQFDTNNIGNHFNMGLASRER